MMPFTKQRSDDLLAQTASVIYIGNMGYKLSLLLFFILNDLNTSNLNPLDQFLVNLNDFPDAVRTQCELIESRNFICDEHWVTTADGYILSVQHIINPVYLSTNKSTIKPVVLAHGLFGSATHFLINSEGGFADDWTDPSDINDDLNIEGRNLPYLMANLGYDVWIPNFRGTYPSRNHTTLDPNNDSAFWQFSFDEMTIYDTPAIIGYVLKQSGYDDLTWIGHSLGSMVMFGLLSERPEYSEKIKPFIALAPVAYVNHLTSPIRYLAQIPLLKSIVSHLGALEFSDALLDFLAAQVCSHSGINSACAFVTFSFTGADAAQLNHTRLPVIYAQGFSSTSWRNFAHLGQLVVSGRFAQYDLGLVGNLLKYKTLSPPDYNLSKINSKEIILMYSANDALADLEDIATLKKELTVPFKEYQVPYPQFNHVDFLWAKDVYPLLYQQLLKFLSEY